MAFNKRLIALAFWPVLWAGSDNVCMVTFLGGTMEETWPVLIKPDYSMEDPYLILCRWSVESRTQCTVHPITPHHAI